MKKVRLECTSMLFKKYVAKSGLSQKQISVAIGYSSPQFISNVVRGISFAPAKRLKKLCEMLGMPMSLAIEAYETDALGETMKRIERYKKRAGK